MSSLSIQKGSKDEETKQEKEDINEISNDENEENDEEDERKLEDDIEELENILENSQTLITDTDFEFLDAKNILKIIEPSEDGWKKAGKKKSNLKPIYAHMRLINSYTSQEPRLAKNIWDMPMKERYKLYNEWVQTYRNRIQQSLNSLQDDYNKSAAILRELRMQEDRWVMQEALIIAMTTTGSARYHEVLKDLKPRIVLVEEAAEVFEAHIVAALSKDCEHLVLIGDHVQLRPNPTVYTLAKEYKIDVSLFERLLNNDTRKEMLTCQHRMRPEISALMRHFYNGAIRDHPSVQNYPAVRGLKTNFFFIDHNQPEKLIKGESSKTNPYEALYLAKLCQYLVKQGYEESRITILSMYLGQLIEIRSWVKDKMKLKVKISTVDNYQGEENDLVLLSLVRSNNDGKIGFLAIENRVCVALSRAKHGFFVIGNFTMLSQAKGGEKWSNIVRSLENRVGKELCLTCTKHPRNDINARSAHDFDLRPEGGCKLPCDARLKCGHVCKLLCHNYDTDHKEYKCLSPCHKIIKKCGHRCTRPCSHKDKCEAKCSEMVPKHIKECQHQVLFRCDTEPTLKDCQQSCTKFLSCGDRCSFKCGQIPCPPCAVPIQVDSVCKHLGRITVKCSDPIWTYQKVCGETCSEVLECGHLCSSTCGECFGGRIHGGCKEKCERPLLCGHKCTVNCARQCLPCVKKCENRCSHSKCLNDCGAPCAPCKICLSNIK